MECSWWEKDILDPGRLGSQAQDALPEVQEKKGCLSPKYSLEQLAMLQEVLVSRIALLEGIILNLQGMYVAQSDTQVLINLSDRPDDS